MDVAVGVGARATVGLGVSIAIDREVGAGRGVAGAFVVSGIGTGVEDTTLISALVLTVACTPAATVVSMFGGGMDCSQADIARIAIVVVTVRRINLVVLHGVKVVIAQRLHPLLDKFRDALADDHRGGVRIGADAVGHDCGVGNAQAFDAVHSGVLVDDRHAVRFRAHLACAGDVVAGSHISHHPVVECLL